MSAAVGSSGRNVRWRLSPPAFLRYRAGKIGALIGGGILIIALIGPLVAPHSPFAIVGQPFQRPTSSFPCGTDFLGRDVLSRVLAGGLSLLWLSLLATALAYAIGITTGLVAGYVRSIVDPVLMRAMDILLAFPPILFLLVLAAGAGHSKVALVVGIAAVQLGGIARIVRSATLEISVRNYVEAAVARGQATWRILSREILPNISGSLLADAGVRLTGSILLLASVNFLGLGLQPPVDDWALMISENRSGITLQPWVIAIPAVLIALLTIAVNLIADAIGRGLGVSIHPESVKR